MNILRLILFFLITGLSLGLAFSEKTEDSPAGENHIQEYQCEAVPIGKEEESEEIEAIFSFEDDRVVVSSTKVSQKAEERTLLNLTGEGDLISRTRRRSENSYRGPHMAR